MLVAREQSTACDPIYERSGIAPIDVNTLVSAHAVLPLNGNPARSVLAFDAERSRYVPRTYLVEMNQTDSCDSVAVVELRTKRPRKVFLHHLGVNSEVDKQSSPDHSA
jgi:hypothetical protein